MTTQSRPQAQRPISRLADLPSELCLIVFNDSDLENKDILNLSLVSRRFRALCIPSLFYSVVFPCSKYGLEDLQRFLHSECRKSVIHFTYCIPPFFNPEVEDFEHFFSVMNPPESVTSLQGSHDPDNVRARFASLHDIYRTHHRETKEIVESGLDYTALSGALIQLPPGTDLVLEFRSGILDHTDKIYKTDKWIRKPETYKHHIPVMERAISHAKAHGQHFSSVRLVRVKMPEGESWGDSKSQIRESLERMFSGIDCIRLSLSPSVVRLFKGDSLGIHDVELLNLTLPQWIFKKFLLANVAALKTIGVYGVVVTAGPDVGEDITQAELVQMLNELAVQAGVQAYWKATPLDGLIWRVEWSAPVKGSKGVRG
ncbi:hypothetical protein BJX99DRAFT_265057 [Aspergillus californicus]